MISLIPHLHRPLRSPPSVRPNLLPATSRRTPPTVSTFNRIPPEAPLIHATYSWPYRPNLLPPNSTRPHLPPTCPPPSPVAPLTSARPHLRLANSCCPTFICLPPTSSCPTYVRPPPSSNHPSPADPPPSPTIPTTTAIPNLPPTPPQHHTSYSFSPLDWKTDRLFKSCLII